MQHMCLLSAAKTFFPEYLTSSFLIWAKISLFFLKQFSPKSVYPSRNAQHEVSQKMSHFTTNMQVDRYVGRYFFCLALLSIHNHRAIKVCHLNGNVPYNLVQLYLFQKVQLSYKRFFCIFAALGGDVSADLLSCFLSDLRAALASISSQCSANISFRAGYILLRSGSSFIDT